MSCISLPFLLQEKQQCKPWTGRAGVSQRWEPRGTIARINSTQAFISLHFHKCDKAFSSVCSSTCFMPGLASILSGADKQTILPLLVCTSRKRYLEKFVSVFFTTALCLRLYDAWPFLLRISLQIFVSICEST